MDHPSTVPRAREHYYEKLGEVLRNNFVRHIADDPAKIASSEFEPRICAIDVEHELFCASKLSNSYKAAILRKVNEINKMTDIGHLHPSLLPKWETGFKSASDMLKEALRRPSASSSEFDEDAEGEPEAKSGVTLGGFQTAAQFLKKQNCHKTDSDLSDAGISGNMKFEPPESCSGSTYPVIKREMPKVKYFFVKGSDDEADASVKTEFDVSNKGLSSSTAEPSVKTELGIKMEPSVKTELGVKSEPVTLHSVRPEPGFIKKVPKIKYFFEKDSDDESEAKKATASVCSTANTEPVMDYPSVIIKKEVPKIKYFFEKSDDDTAISKSDSVGNGETYCDNKGKRKPFDFYRRSPCAVEEPQKPFDFFNRSPFEESEGDMAPLSPSADMLPFFGEEIEKMFSRQKEKAGLEQMVDLTASPLSESSEGSSVEVISVCSGNSSTKRQPTEGVALPENKRQKVHSRSVSPASIPMTPSSLGSSMSPATEMAWLEGTPSPCSEVHTPDSLREIRTPTPPPTPPPPPPPPPRQKVPSSSTKEKQRPTPGKSASSSSRDSKRMHSSNASSHSSSNSDRKVHQDKGPSPGGVRIVNDPQPRPCHKSPSKNHQASKDRERPATSSTSSNHGKRRSRTRWDDPSTTNTVDATNDKDKQNVGNTDHHSVSQQKPSPCKTHTSFPPQGSGAGKHSASGQDKEHTKKSVAKCVDVKAASAVVVKYLTLHFKGGQIASKEVFKGVARIISHKIAEEKIPEHLLKNRVKELLKFLFKRCPKVKSEQEVKDAMSL